MAFYPFHVSFSFLLVFVQDDYDLSPPSIVLIKTNFRSRISQLARLISFFHSPARPSDVIGFSLRSFPSTHAAGSSRRGTLTPVFLLPFFPLFLAPLSVFDSVAGFVLFFRASHQVTRRLFLPLDVFPSGFD